MAKERYVSTNEVLVIGAGPYGLSISAHLHGLGVDHLIVGRPMDSWRRHMPVGMYLKSEPYGSDMSSPHAGFDIAAYCRSRGMQGIERGEPLPIETFLDYGHWYAEHLVPDVRDATVTEINAVDGGFRVAFADAEPVAARQVVVATGFVPHSHIPAELSGLPSELVSHTVDHHRFDRFQGRRVAVVGAGQSALETAALLHEAGADAQLVVRDPAAPGWHPKPLPLTLYRRVRLPVTKLCEGWKCVLWNSPAAFHRLPQNVRITKARTVLGPRGAWWLRERVEGVVDILAGYHVRGATAIGSSMRLQLDGPRRTSIDADHVIAGTGFRLDMGRLTFLPERLRENIATLNGHPVLTRACESTVPGLYFAGAAAAVSLGPSMRFIAGTHNSAGQLARSLARRSRMNGGSPVTSEADDTSAAGAAAPSRSISGTA
jgi:FAD-dependent urate hydroxylase